MIGIKINGEFIDLATDTRINLKLNSPIFADGNIIPGSYSIPFNIPIGDAAKNNNRIFNHPDVIENTTFIDKYDADLFVYDVFYKRGQLKITGVSDTSMTANFVFGFNALKESLKDVTIRDACNSVVILWIIDTVKIVTLSFGTENKEIGITINGFTYSQNVTNASDSPNPLVTLINAESFQNNCVASNVGNKLQLVPNAGAFEVDTPFQVSGNSGDWIVETNIDAYNTKVDNAIKPYFDEGNEPNDIIRFPMFKNFGAYSSGEHDTFEVNANTTTALKPNIPGGSDTILNLDFGLDFTPLIQTSLCPQVKLSYVLQQIEAYFGIAFIGDFIGSNWYNKALIFNTNYLDQVVPFLGDTKSFIFFKKTVDVSEHIPDMKVNDFLKALQTRFNLALYYKENTNEIVLNYRNSITTNKDYEDITAFSGRPIVADITVTEGVVLKSPRNDEDQYSLIDEHVAGINREVSITTKAGHISQYINTYGSDYRGFEVPVVEREKSAKDLVLVFERYNKSMLSESDTFMTFDIDEPTDGYLFEDLAATQWDSYLRFLLNRKITTAIIDLPLRSLLAIDFEKKYRINGINYLLKSVDFTLTMDGVEPASVEMYTA